MNKPMYEYESQLVNDFRESLGQQESPLQIRNYAQEFNYGSGKTDIVAVSNDGDVVAFEAKLEKWKVAFHQAYKNSTFAHYSYVVLSPESIENALMWSHQFEKFGIGLCTVINSSINIFIHGKRREPLLNWLTESALSFVEEGSDAKFC